MAYDADSYWDLYFRHQDGEVLGSDAIAVLNDPTMKSWYLADATAKQAALARAEARRKAAGIQQQQKDVIAIREAEKQASKIKTVDPSKVQVRLGGTEDAMERTRKIQFRTRVDAPAIAVKKPQSISTTLGRTVARGGTSYTTKPPSAGSLVGVGSVNLDEILKR